MVAKPQGTRADSSIDVRIDFPMDKKKESLVAWYKYMVDSINSEGLQNFREIIGIVKLQRCRLR